MLPQGGQTVLTHYTSGRSRGDDIAYKNSRQGRGDPLLIGTSLKMTGLGSNQRERVYPLSIAYTFCNNLTNSPSYRQNKFTTPKIKRWSYSFFLQVCCIRLTVEHLCICNSLTAYSKTSLPAYLYHWLHSLQTSLLSTSVTQIVGEAHNKAPPFSPSLVLKCIGMSAACQGCSLAIFSPQNSNLPVGCDGNSLYGVTL